MNEEREVKFYLNNPAALERRLQIAGARLLEARVHEVNLRFDTPQGELTAAQRVLRLRQDRRARLTYKGPTLPDGEIARRLEIEFEVSDFEAARAFLEALGYRVSIMYEKYRTTYTLPPVEVMLDEMPYGWFAEIEGHRAEEIHAAALALGLRWEARCTVSYMVLFERLKRRRNLSAPHLRFDDLQGLSIVAADLELSAADGEMDDKIQGKDGAVSG